MLKKRLESWPQVRKIEKMYPHPSGGREMIVTVSRLEMGNVGEE